MRFQYYKSQNMCIFQGERYCEFICQPAAHRKTSVYRKEYRELEILIFTGLRHIRLCLCGDNFGGTTSVTASDYDYTKAEILRSNLNILWVTTSTVCSVMRIHTQNTLHLTLSEQDIGVLHQTERAHTIRAWDFLTLLKLDVIRHNNTCNQRFDLVNSEEATWAVEEQWDPTLDIRKHNYQKKSSPSVSPKSKRQVLRRCADR